MGLHARIHTVALQGMPVLHDIALDIPAARWTAIVGPNGAGKSTLLRTLAGLQACDGQVRLGWPLRQGQIAKALARELAWLGQAEAGAQDLRAQDVVMLGRLPHQGWLAPPSVHDLAAAQQAMRLTHCWDWRCRPMGQLSGGERQRVLLARALAVQARVLLMDEPLAHLDPPHQADWLDIVRAQVAQGVTVVSVLHELNMALHADELVVMREGRVVHQGPADSPAAHAALVDVFDGRVRLAELDGQWVAFPHSGLARHPTPAPTSLPADEARDTPP
jgi:iron complex transport system ATP-binding protein